MDETLELDSALENYKVALKKYAKADTLCEGDKKLFDCKVSAMIIEAEGKSFAERERIAKSSTPYDKLLREHLNKLHESNLSKAIMEGARATYETERSKLSYRKSLIDKGIL